MARTLREHRALPLRPEWEPQRSTGANGNRDQPQRRKAIVPTRLAARSSDGNARTGQAVRAKARER